MSGHFQLKAETNETGTIVIAYQTDDNDNHNLDRIRFWLINPHEERILYPKKDEFVSNHHIPNERTVVIPNLAPGQYQIKFLIPKTENFLEPIPPRRIQIGAGEVIKIEQRILPTSSLQRGQ